MTDKKTNEEVRFDSIETLSEAKTLAESRVKLIRSLLEDEEIEDKQYRNMEILYDEARADVNAGLDRLLVELETTGSQGTLEPYDRIAQRAAERAAQFLEVSDQVIFGKDRGILDAGVKLVDSLIKAFIDVWKVLRGEKKERHALLLQRIESLKWGEFSEVK